MSFPVYFHIGPLALHPHFVMELAAYAMGLYLTLFKRLRNVSASSGSDNSGSDNSGQDSSGLMASQRTSVAVGALVGALIGAKLLVALQHINVLSENWRLYLLIVLQGKTIVGALLGGLVGVETTKRIIGVRQSTGDSFVYSVLWGTAIGRIGCFLTGLSDRTYGIATTLPWGIDFGDGITRHPTQLYEVGFLLLLFFVLRGYESLAKRPHQRLQMRNGDLFKIYMIAYLAFRFGIDFIKPEFRLVLNLSAIQIACLGGLGYYRKDIVRLSQAIF